MFKVIQHGKVPFTTLQLCRHVLDMCLVPYNSYETSLGDIKVRIKSPGMNIVGSVVFDKDGNFLRMWREIDED